MLVVAVFLCLVSLSEAIELADRCELSYKKCAFDCVQEFPLDEKKRKGCITRCKLNKGWCKAGKAVKDVAKDINRFFEGFTKDRD